jgi:bla regulator protein BlaR1
MTEALFFLLNHLWQSTLVAAAAWLACRTMLKANSPAVRFAVWLVVSVKFLVPFAVFVEAGHRLYVRPLLTVVQSRQVFDLVRGGNSGLATAPFRVARAPQALAPPPSALLMTLAIVWALGAVVVLFGWLASWWTIRRAARNAVPSGDFHGVPILQSPHMRDERIEPGVFGLWRQTILIPAGMETTLSAAEFKVVLSHEWNHARRRDNLTAALQMLTEAVFWFYPVVWMVGRRLTEERELACDQAVLEQAHAQVDEAEAYAEGILKVCKLYTASPLPCVAGITGANLRSRIELILKNVRPRPLNYTKRLALAGALLAAIAGPAITGFLTAPAASAQQGNSFVGLATSAEKKFEVATVKLNPSGDQRFQLGPPGGGRITIVNVPLRGIIVQSFRTQRNMVFGIPNWAESERYDIVGKGPDPKMTNPEVWEMMRSLLIERFHLKYHVEDREMPVYALTVAPRGLKLTLGENGRCRQELKDGRNCGDILVPPFGTAMYNMPIGALITGIGARAGRPIVDKTALTGKYDANIIWLPDGVKLEDLDLNNVPPEFRPDDISVFQALEQQAGLKLVPERAAVPVVVIDSVSRPDPN